MAVGDTIGPAPWRARTAGAAYLITIVMGLFAEAFVRGGLITPGSPAVTASNILAQEPLYRLAVGADLVMLVAYLVVTLLFLDMFRPVNRSLSELAALFSLIGIAVLAANSTILLAALTLLHGGAISLASMALKAHGQGYAVAIVFFAVYGLLIGWLIVRCGFLPRAVGVLMAAGGLGYAVGSADSILALHLPAPTPDLLSLVGFLGEAALSLWLLAVGPRARITKTGI
jgi:hypothetical protein